MAILIYIYKLAHKYAPEYVKNYHFQRVTGATGEMRSVGGAKWKKNHLLLLAPLLYDYINDDASPFF